MINVTELYPKIFRIETSSEDFLATINLTPKITFYGEKTIQFEDKEYRAWNPYRSKLAAAIKKGIKHIPITYGAKILYLGVASGTTCSHISDIVGWAGHVWGIDISPNPLRDLINNLARSRKNVSPILGDARRPEEYSAIMTKVDGVYSDVAQPDQVEILVRNARFYLKSKGWIILALKSRSIDSIVNPKKIYAETIELLEKEEFQILEKIELGPYAKDHAFITAKNDF